MTDKPRYVRALFNWEHGIAMLRLFGYFSKIKAPWAYEMFSERYQVFCKVIPLGFGWKFIIKEVDRV